MLPDLSWHTIPIGPISLQVWGLFVALGILAATLLAKRVAQQRGLNGEVVVDVAFWTVVSAFIGSRIFFVVTEWSLFANDFAEIFKIWDGGMSISGGFIGAVLAGVIYLRHKKLSFWQYADAIVYALPLGLGIGRLGCFFIFDHPGSVTSFVLGEVYYADGLVHHNHGLYLSISGFVLFGLFTLIKRLRRDGLQSVSTVGIFLLWDGFVRIILDFDRILDSHFLGLTAAQWVGVVSVLIGLSLTFSKKKGII